ncbi:hypothetical protein BJ508DRAFT_308453 [Ascobolus immersus RN42]|uniref:Uncharacterized protein n=1 Tax=Ascobolus immersus RN42 TaxID=1160509 RepID=A0A3N4I5I3_ASCIM|nr:hypothetical protein BJ508DRAFT_308453 [Ascobolus immersus RN42]
MTIPSLRHLLAVLLLTSVPVLAADNKPLSDEFVQKELVENNGLGIAMASRPLWHFATMKGQKMCMPTSAINSDFKQTPYLNPDLFPLAGSGCPDPGVPVGSLNDTTPFPTYYTITNCTDTELRIVYNMFFQKDGFAFVYPSPCNGHRYDWERIIVIWRQTLSGDWIRDKLLTSFHNDYHEYSWPEVETFSHDDPNRTSGLNLEGPKIYVGWGKHAMFKDRKTTWNDCFSQGCAREYRSSDWWFLPGKKELVYAGVGSGAGDAMEGMEWGKADSYPTAVERKVCRADGKMRGPNCWARSPCEEMEGMGDDWSIETSVHKDKMGWTSSDVYSAGNGKCGDEGTCHEDVEKSSEGRLDL